MSILFIILAFIISASIVQLIIPRILLISLRKKLFDMPSERKVHKRAIPRLGGISFFLAILLSSCGVLALRILMGYDVPIFHVVYLLSECMFLVRGMTLLYLTDAADDLVRVRYRQKFVIQIICVSFFLLTGLWINNFCGLFGLYALPAWTGMPFTVLLIVFVANAINLIDGIDGLASDLSSVTLLVFDFLFMRKELWAYSMFAFVTFGVLVPFSYYNVLDSAGRARKIFMGNTSNPTLGYMLSFLAIKYGQYDPDVTPYTEGAFMITFSTLVVPAFDMIRVVIVRVRNDKSPFEPDKNHIHHEFLAMGLAPRKTMVTILLVSCAFSAVNILLALVVDNTMMLLADITIWVGLNLWFDRIRDKKQK